MSAVPGGWDQSQMPESSTASQASSGPPETIRPQEATSSTVPHEDTTQNRPTTSPPPHSSTVDTNTATAINDAVREYIDRSPLLGPWPHQYHFASIPLHQIESKGPDFEKREVMRAITQAHSKWRKGLKLLKVYPEEIEWKTLPTQLTDLLQYALVMDQVIGVDKGKLTLCFFINYEAHERFSREINTYATQHKYVTSAPHPRWLIPSHFDRLGMDERTAFALAWLYRAEAKLILYDLLNIGSERTNATLIEDPDILYRLRGQLWKFTPEEHSSRRGPILGRKPKETPIGETVNVED